MKMPEPLNDITTTDRPFHYLDALSKEKGRDFDGLFIPKAEGLAREDAIDAIRRDGQEAQLEWLRFREETFATIKQMETALRGIVNAIDAHHPKFAHGPFTLTRAEIEACRSALANRPCQVCGDSGVDAQGCVCDCEVRSGNPSMWFEMAMHLSKNLAAHHEDEDATNCVTCPWGDR